MCNWSHKEIAGQYLKKIMVENFPKLIKAVNTKIKEVQQSPSTKNMKNSTPSHTIKRLL